MNNKKKYENVIVELVFIDARDVIATSSIGNGDDIDKDGWTTVVNIDW